MDDFIKYIDGITLEGRPIVTSKRKTPFVGFKNNAIALKIMYEEIVETKMMDKICTTDLQQDLLESFFSRMRSKGGCNTNPTQEQFGGIFRKTVLNSELTSSALANCIDRLKIMHISSKQPEDQDEQQPNYIMNIQETDDDEGDDELAGETCANIEMAETSDEEVNPSGKTIQALGIAQFAGSTEHIFDKMDKMKKKSCKHCATICEINEKIDADLWIKNSKFKRPCKSTYEICCTVNTEMSKYLKKVHLSHFNYWDLLEMIRKRIKFEDLYSKTNDCLEHKTDMIDSLIEAAVKLKCYAKAREETLKHQESNFSRSSKIHDIHFTGQ